MVSLIKIIFCFSILVLASLSQIPLLQYDWHLDAFKIYDYSILYLSCFILSSLFRNNYCFAAVILFLIAGLSGLPIFAFGGGWTYVTEASFGYLLALIPMSIIVFYFKHHKQDFSALLAIVIAHLCGLAFLLVTARLNFKNLLDLSFYQIIYDLIFTALFLVFTRNKNEIDIKDSGFKIC